MRRNLPAPLVYLDANALIAGFELPLEQARPVQDFLRALRARPRAAVTSELTVAELLAPTLREGALPQGVKKRLYLDLLVGSQLIDLRPVTREILVETAELRQSAPHRLPDAIHVVTAMSANCGFFLSGDKRIKPRNGVSLVHPNRAGIDLILNAWSGKA